MILRVTQQILMLCLMTENSPSTGRNSGRVPHQQSKLFDTEGRQACIEATVDGVSLVTPSSSILQGEEHQQQEQQLLNSHKYKIASTSNSSSSPCVVHMDLMSCTSCCSS